MNGMVRSFGELTAEEWRQAGGKGGTLARLSQTGYPVPDGFCILPLAFVDDQLVYGAWVQVRAELERLRPTGEATMALAVRSSALGEDSAQASFAGEFETVLDVHTDEMVREAIHTVRRSRHAERVQAYTQARGVETDPQHGNGGYQVAVVVQKLVRADFSGVLFTADPITGSSRRMMGNYVHGLGDELVSGEVEPYTFTLTRPKGLTLGRAKGLYEGPDELKRHARVLHKLADRLEKELGYPQDIEWAIAGDKLYLLQSRPITTLVPYDPATGEWNDSLSGDYLWTNTNLVEAVPDVMTPSTWSLVQILHFDTATAILPKKLPLTGNICGRPYINVSLALAIYCATGMKLHEAIRRVEELFGRLPQGLDLSVPSVFSLFEMLRLIPANLRLEIQFRRRIRSMPEFVAQAPERCKELLRRVQGAGTRAELVSVWRQELEPYVYHAFTMLRGAMKWFDNPAAVLRHDLIERVGEADANALLSNISGDGELLASLGPVVGVAKVAAGEMDRAAYLERYGHRGPHEWELSVPQPAEDDSWLDRQLAAYTASPVDVEGLLRQQRSAYEAAWLRLQERYPKEARSLGHRIAKFDADARLREAVRSEVTRMAGVVRAFALRAGELTGLDDGVFFLSLDEILDLLANNGSAATLAMARIPARRETHARYSALSPYPMFINGRFDPIAWAADPQRRSDLFDSHTSFAASAPASDTLTGFAGAAGCVEGIVRRLDSTEEGDQLRPGEVLVTTTTNVGWTPLFPRTAAIVTDVGAPLSHAAIVARELGIPAVVGCGDATMRLRTGDRVRVDGGRGVVEVL